MTPKQILDSFSTTLMQDERILSAQERALLTALLQHAKAATGRNREIQEAVDAIIAQAVGETAAHRAFSVLGGSIVERILEDISISTESDARQSEVERGAQAKQPEPPSGVPLRPPQTGPGGKPAPPQPEPPSPKPGRPAPMKGPGQPEPPNPGSPGGPGVEKKAISGASVGTVERPAALPAKCVVLDEFLAPQEVEQLMRFTLEHESDFRASEVVSPAAEGGVIDYDHRRSRVLSDVDRYEDVMLQRIRSVLPEILEKLGMDGFSAEAVEAQITASNDGDFFRFHSDNGSERVADRQLTFVYFFQREPRQFEGGELRIHDARLEGGTYVSDGTYQTIAPQQNQIVFFPCELMHEVTPVTCPSRLFADSRFTLNGWLRR
jgi:Rps23 Pro-64 3,4-dihydroxylase Tpa1-like proline 4-hydroxylase